MLGLRPVATSRWVPTMGSAPSRGVSTTPSPEALSRLLIDIAEASTITVTPSASRMSLMVAETSSSSRAVSRGPFSTTVTSAPKRRYIWANSKAM